MVASPAVSVHLTKAGKIPMNAKKTKYGIRYDGDLQMFCESVHELDLGKLRFMRWLAEQGRLEHPIAGPPAGEHADRASE